MNLWQKAHKKAKTLKNVKTKSVRRRHIVALCEAWKRALRGVAQ